NSYGQGIIFGPGSRVSVSP
ncbi:rCG64454, partial [Rattus norvegicus]